MVDELRLNRPLPNFTHYQEWWLEILIEQVGGTLWSRCSSIQNIATHCTSAGRV